MPKFPTLPPLYDEVLQLSITNLKRDGFLKPDFHVNGITTWSCNGNKTGSIGIEVNTKGERPYVELNYQYKDEPRKYKIRLVTVLSNLGKGNIWYFLCPQTNKRCRKLYSIGGYFYHREAFNGCMYETQTRSKQMRRIDKSFGAYFRAESFYKELNKKHFKRTYAGEPTKRYLWLMEQIQKAEKVTAHDIESAMLFGV